MNLNTEPANIVGTITAAVTAVIALLVSYGFDITETQQSAILGVVAVAAPLFAAVIIRSKVYAPDTVQTVKRDAYAQGLDDAQPPDVMP